MTEITAVDAWEVLDSRGDPTVRVRVETRDGSGQFTVPAGASTGAHEAVERREHRLHRPVVPVAQSPARVVQRRRVRERERPPGVGHRPAADAPHHGSVALRLGGVAGRLVPGFRGVAPAEGDLPVGAPDANRGFARVPDAVEHRVSGRAIGLGVRVPAADESHTRG